MFWSLVGIAATLLIGLFFVSLRRYEATRGVRFFETARTDFDIWATKIFEHIIQGGVPVSWRSQFTAFLHAFTHTIVDIAVWLVRSLEHRLARFSYHLRVTAPKGSAQVSEFLRTLTPDKRP